MQRSAQTKKEIVNHKDERELQKVIFLKLPQPQNVHKSSQISTMSMSSTEINLLKERILKHELEMQHKDCGSSTLGRRRAEQSSEPSSAAAQKYLLACKNPFNQNLEEDPLSYEVDTEWITTLSFEIHVLEAI